MLRQNSIFLSLIINIFINNVEHKFKIDMNRHECSVCMNKRVNVLVFFCTGCKEHSMSSVGFPFIIE